MTTTPSRPIVRYHGGKWRLAPWIISHFPEHRCYVEPFCGAASVFLHKPRSMFEVLNDLYGRIVNVFQVLRDPVAAKRLEELLRATACAEQEYILARTTSDDPVEDARRMIVLGHQAHGSTGACGGKLSGWRRGIREHGPSSSMEWRDLWQHVGSWADRLRGAYIEQASAIEVMQRWDDSDALHYVDPPYVAETRQNGARSYAHEMTDLQHEELAAALKGLRGAVIVSGYHSKLYDRLFRSWQRIERPHLADKGRTSIEVLWLRNVRLKSPELSL